MKTVTVVRALLAWVLVSVTQANTLEIFVNHQITRFMQNASFGLQFHDQYQHQCSANGQKRVQHPSGKVEYMGYTPNRRLQSETVNDAEHQNVQLGIVLAVGAHSDQYYNYGPAGSLNGLLAVWDSWVDNFFPQVSNTTSLVLLLDERDFFKQNITRSSASYLDSILIDNMGAKPADCVMLRNFRMATPTGRHAHSHHTMHVHNNLNHRRQPAGCLGNDLHLDQGYKVYYIDVSNSTDPSSVQAPFLIFAGVHKFPAPAWAKNEDEEHLFIHWRPWRMGRFKTNYGYVKMTNWYAYHMLNLQVLDFFDYAGKLDNDVSFVAPFPETNLPLRLAAKDTKMLVTQNGWYFDSERVAQGVRLCLNAYIEEEKKLCSKENNLASSLVPGGQGATIFWESNLNATFRAHFLVYWLGIYAAPETKAMALYWNEWHPRGMWDYRWGDQQWWPRPLAMFGTGDVDKEIEHYDLINTDNEKYVVHKLWPRHATIEKTRYFNFSGSTRAQRDALYAVAAKPYL